MRKKEKNIFGKKNFGAGNNLGILAVIGIVAVVLIVSFSGCIKNPFEQKTQPPTEETVCATFDITPSVSAGRGQLNSAEDTVTIGFYANTTAHTIAEDDNTTWVDTQITFAIKPIAPLGAKDYDLSTLYYEVTNPDATVDSASDTYYMVTKSGGNRQLIWTGDGTHYVKGSTTMKMTGNETLYLTIDTAQTDMSYVENEMDPQQLTIRFSNGCGWTEYFYIKFICIDSHN